MSKIQTLRGFATISYWADDMEAAKAWYSEPIDRRFAPARETAGPGGAIMYWHVDDIEATLKNLKSMGAEEYEPIQHRGTGFITASVIDPFGNVLGIMYNQHYLEILNSRIKGNPSNDNR